MAEFRVFRLGFERSFGIVVDSKIIKLSKSLDTFVFWTIIWKWNLISEKDLNLHEYDLYRWLKNCQFPKMPRGRDFRVPYKVKSHSKSAPHKVRRRVYCYNSLIPPRNAHSAHSYPRANIECRIDQSRLGQSWTGSKPVVEKKFPDACSSKEMTLDISIPMPAFVCKTSITSYAHLLFRAFQLESFLYRTKETREECLETDPFSRYFFKEL